MKKEPNPIDRHVGSRLRMKRVLAGMTQQKMGAALGLTFQQVQKYEKGTNRIGASRLQDISKILDVAPGFFFEGAASGTSGLRGFAEESSSTYVVDFLSTAEGLHLNKAFARIHNPKVRRRIVELVAALADSETEA